MICKTLLSLYLPALLLMTAAPLGGLNTTLNHTTVIHLRLDYLLHALMFMPLAPLWRLGFPRHPLRMIIPAGLALAIGLEGVQYLLPYRAWNVNDAIGNGAGVLLSPLLLVIRRPTRFWKFNSLFLCGLA
jgi:glycopeptide antibiotics resistance protein